MARDALTPAQRAQRKHNWKRRYGITRDDYTRMLKRQRGRCAICRGTSFGRRNANHFSVDHDHVSGKVRGLLCSKCNLILGNAKDNVATLIRAVAYLTHHKEKQ